MWACWAILGFLQISSVRYFKLWNLVGKFQMYIHAFIGIAILVLTILMKSVAENENEENDEETPESVHA